MEELREGGYLHRAKNVDFEGKSLEGEIDDSSIIFLLKNLKYDLWRNKELLKNKGEKKMKKVLSLAMIGLMVFSMLSILASMPVLAETVDQYFIYSKFDPPGIGDVVAAGGYVEYYGVPEWGDEIQYVYFLSGNTGYKVKVWTTDGDGDGKVEPRQHPNHYLSEFVGPIEPRHFQIVSSKDLTGYTGGSSWHTEEFYVDSSGVYLGAYPYGINKWDHNWNYIGKIANSPPERCESMAYNPAENVWYAGGRYRTIYQLKDTNNDGSFLDESWAAIFSYPSYGGDHHDGMEYVGGFLWISDMTSDVIGKWQYNPTTSAWEELKRFTYTEPGYVEGMGFGPNDHFWVGSGWGSNEYIYELGNEITLGYPIADAGPDVDAHPPTIPVKFDASGSHHTDPTKEIVLYEWDFESDGVWDYSGIDLIVEHAYPAYYNPDGTIDWGKTAKDYTATLRVTDNSDPPLRDSDTRIVHITAPPWKPVADPDGPYEGYVNAPVQLDGSKSFDPESKMFPPDHPWYETIATYEWDLDHDGQFDDATGAKPTYTWDSEGLHIIGLKVTDSQPSGPGGTVGPLDVDTKYTTVAISKVLVRVTVTIVEVRAIDRMDPAGPLSAADFYAKVSIDGQSLPSTTVKFPNQDDIYPEWSFSLTVSKTVVPIYIGIWDSDPWPNPDDHVDIDKDSSDRDLDISFDVTTQSLSGDVTFGYSKGGGGDGNRAEIWLNVGLDAGDKDGDGLFDSWETTGIHMDDDGVVDLDLPSLGASPDNRDLFVEIDWMEDGAHSHRPTDEAIQTVINAFARFLTLPFRDPDIKIQQGWRYNAPIGPDPTDPYAHKGIDYIKGTIGEPATWQSFDVVAAADGVAMQSSGGGYGTFVYIRHNERDSTGNNYFTLYAHLNSVATGIVSKPRGATDYSTWTPIRRGEFIGRAGDTGSPGLIHLHFELQRGGYPLGKTDPYDLYTTRGFYPGGSNYIGCGPNHLWTTDPPTLATNQPKGISLHVDLSNSVQYQDEITMDDFDAIKADNFDANRRFVYHYGLFAHGIHDGAAGLGEYPGNDFLIGLGDTSTSTEQAVTFMHELGHNLYLHHGGGDDLNFKPNYLSVMNYFFAWRGGIPPTYRIDYSRLTLPSLDENSLDENLGIQDGADNTMFYTPDGTIETWPGTGAIDWDNDNIIETNVRADVNRDGIYIGPIRLPKLTVLTGFNDWANIKLNSRGITNDWADCVHESYDVEEDIETLRSIRPTEVIQKFAEGPVAVPLYTIKSWNFTFMVTNIYDYEIYNLTVKDYFGANLDVAFLSSTKGSYTQFTNEPGRQQRFIWTIESLTPFETVKLKLEVSTGLNPAKKQEFTQAGLKVLNSGATIKWVNSTGRQGSAESGQVSIWAGVYVSDTTGAIAGYVTNATTGEPLSGYLIELRNSAGIMVATVTTDEKGFYSFSSLTPGDYVVTCSGQSYTATVTAEQVTRVDFEFD